MLTIADAWLHNLSPFALRISGQFGIRWYGLAYAAGFLIALLVARSLAKRKLIQLSPQQVGDFIIYCILGVLIGGRLGYIIFYEPQAITTFTNSLPYWEVLAINHGGMASHGGMIGVIIAMIFFGHKHRISPFHLFDIAALLVPFGFFFGRIANFINGELRGIPCSSDFPLAVKFPQEINQWGTQQMAQAVDAARALGLTKHEWMQIVTNSQISNTPGTVDINFLRRRLIELVQTGNQTVINAVKPILIPRYPSQLYQAAAEGIVLGSSLWLLWYFIFRKGKFKNRPGLTGCAFLIIYGILRIITEIWRLPDEGVSRTFGLSRGQLLSAAMIIAGIATMAFLLTKGKHAVKHNRISNTVNN